MEEPQYPQTAPKTHKIRLWPIIVGLLVVLLVGGSAYLYAKWQSSQDNLKSAQVQLKSRDANIRKLDARLQTVGDILRKKDLLQFAAVIQTYNQAHGTHLTTEGSLSRNIYDMQLSKGLQDFTDPTTGQVYGYVAVAPVQSPPPLKVGVIQYQWPGKCGAKTIQDTTDQSLTAIATLLENGSMYCLSI